MLLNILSTSTFGPSGIGFPKELFLSGPLIFLKNTNPQKIPQLAKLPNPCPHSAPGTNPGVCLLAFVRVFWSEIFSEPSNRFSLSGNSNLEIPE